MKQLERYLIYVLLLGVAGLYILHFTGNQTEEELPIEESDTLVSQEAGPKEGSIYYVNTDSVWANYEYVQEIFDMMEAKQKQYESQMEGKISNFEREVMEFRERGATMTEMELQIKQRDLMKKETELTELRNNLETKFMEEEREWNEKLRSDIVGFIKERTEDMKYDYILGYSQTSNIILANDSLDLTAQITEGLNAKYAEKLKDKE